MKKYSAFRLFYDNFLYRNNVMIEYDKINKYLNKIIETLKVATTIYHDDAKLYVNSLTKYQNNIKKELDKIMELYPYFFEKYYELYSRYEKTNNSVADMPFVIACSFYNDYGSEQIQCDYVQRFTSLDKKRLRERSKKMSFIQYYKEALKDFDTDAYDSLINLLDSYLNTRIRVDKSFEDNISSHLKIINKIIITNRRILEKAKLNDDYNVIKEKIELIYKGCFKDFDKFFKDQLYDYLLFLYEDDKKNKADFYESTVINDLKYSLYKDFVSKEKKYKEKYERVYNNKQVVNPNRISIAPKFRNKLISIYYDERFFFEESKNVNSLVEMVNSLKSLAWDLEELIWQYILFNASHSAYLKRNNTVRFAIINSLYELYNPYDLLDRYEKNRNLLVAYLDDSKLGDNLELKLADYTKLLTKEDIMNNILDRRKDFIIENSIDNISSKSKDYDTRDYDLYCLAETLTKEEVLDLYKILYKNNKIDMKDIVEYISQCILLVTNPSYSLENMDYELIGDVARTYLNYEYEINLDDDIYLNKRDQFNIVYEAYLGHSSFAKLKKEYKV